MTAKTAPVPARVTLKGDREIHIERIFNAARERVWAAFAERDLIAQWWGRGNQLDIERWEFQVGGHWRFVEHHDEGVDGFEGRFREITAPERLVYTFEWDGMPAYVSIDTVTLEDLGDGRTKLVTESQFHTPEERDGMIATGMEDGLNESYRALDALLAKGI
ncbi:SRPBCC family protein [Jatrophihabitans sp. DSM 45814]